MLVIHQLKTLKDIFRARRQAAGAAAVLAYCLQVWFARDGGPPVGPTLALQSCGLRVAWAPAALTGPNLQGPAVAPLH